ncbi:MAG: hypothetical protein KDD64_14625, partial [Bdellovibrionales bacterium]|nr:hypothetical protein [Bdellovibrionales bacterium]
FTFVLSLIFVPRDFLLNIIPLELHYYRFVCHTMAWWVLVCAIGVVQIVDVVSSRLGTFAANAVVTALILLGLAEYHYRFTLGVLGPEKQPLGVFLSDFPEYSAAQDVVSYFEREAHAPFVAVESTVDFRFKVGSPHTLSSLLTMAGVRSTPGILAESSPQSHYLHAPLRKGSELVKWGRWGLSLSRQFASNDVSLMLLRLGFMGVTHIVSQSSEYGALLSDTLGCVEVKAIGPFRIFQLQTTFPEASETDYRPFLLLPSGARYQEGFDHWYSDARNLPYPLAYSHESIERVLNEDNGLFSGYVVVLNDDEIVTDLPYSRFRLPEQSYIFIGGHPSRDFGERVVFLKRDRKKREVFGLSEALSQLSLSPAKLSPLKIESLSLGSYQLESLKNVIVRWGYSPDWKLKSAGRVYLLSPSHIFFHSRGVEVLQYKEWP